MKDIITNLPRLFCTCDAIDALIKRTKDVLIDSNGGREKYTNLLFVAEIIDLPYTIVWSSMTDDVLEIAKSYGYSEEMCADAVAFMGQRFEDGTYMKDIQAFRAYKLGAGVAGMCRDKGIDQYLNELFTSANGLNYYLQDANLYGTYKKLDPVKEGLSISLNGGEIVATVVSGQNRPSMQCFKSREAYNKVLFEGRPYADELNDSKNEAKDLVGKAEETVEEIHDSAFDTEERNRKWFAGVAKPTTTAQSPSIPLSFILARSAGVAKPTTTAPKMKTEAEMRTCFDKLELYFPEGKVFAFNSIDKDLAERMNELYKEAGYSTVDEMLSAYGFERISGYAVKEIRSFVKYTPGNEPDFIKNKVDNMLRLLEEYYPDQIIPRGLQTDHKSLSSTVSGLYQWFGYEDQKAFLAAYGYEYKAEAGRKARDFQPMLDALIEKYKDGPKPKSMGELLFDNPDLKGPIKTLSNKSNEVFGMTLKKYFEQIGIFETRGTGSTHSARSVSSGVQEAVHETLAKLYSDLDEDIHGTVDDAMGCLEGMCVKQNAKGQVYIFCAVDCDDTVTIPYGIDFISSGAFSGQPNLKEVIISSNITEIPTEAFSDCPALTSVHIPETVVAIGEKAFANCKSLKSIRLPESVQMIAKKGFAGCSSISEVEIANPRIMVSEDAFDNCLYEYVPAPQTDATDAALFDYTTDYKGNVTITGFNGNLEKIVIPGIINGHPVTAIGKGAFRGNKQLVDVSMSDFIGTMEGDAFRDCFRLRKIHISNGISEISYTCFSGCIGLQEINIPDGVTELKRWTFKDSPLICMHIGKSLMLIDSNSFNNGEYDQYTKKKKTTRAINKIIVDPANRYLKASGAAVMSADGKTFMAFLGNAKNYGIPEGVETIAASAFEGLEFLLDIDLPDSVVEIGEKAFRGTSLRRVSLGKNVKRIKSAAFEGCVNLGKVVLPNGLLQIGKSVFRNCRNLTDINLPDSLKKNW